MAGPTKEQLSAVNIHCFVDAYEVKTEQGIPLEFKNRAFLWDILGDMSPLQCVIKAPQIGMTTIEIIKTFWVAKNLGKDIIYTLPTQSDVEDMAGGKINRIIAQNPVFGQWVKDHDSVGSKRVGDNTISYRGTWTTKQAMMVSSGLNVHDEVDASKQSVIEQYETRLMANAESDQWRWYFSHPLLPDVGLDKYWQQSDQKHWFIKCATCEHEQYLEWPESIDPERRCYQCKECKAELSDEERRKGRWVQRWPISAERPFSGYWVSQLMCPWISAEKILNDFKEKTPEYFWNYVLGLPYAGGGAKLTQLQLFGNLTEKNVVPEKEDRVIIGIDTGLRIDYVLGNEELGLFHHGDSDGYDVLDGFMTRWPKAIAVIDGGGDLIGAVQFYNRYPGRVFRAYAGEDRKDNELVRWGEEDKAGQVIYDLNRMWQLCVDEFREQRVPLQGTENDWWEYWLDWKNMSRIKVLDPKTEMFKGFKWVRNGRNHRASATLFWRIGMMRFSSEEKGEILGKSEALGHMGYESHGGRAFMPILRNPRLGQ